MTTIAITGGGNVVELPELTSTLGSVATEDAIVSPSAHTLAFGGT